MHYLYKKPQNDLPLQAKDSSSLLFDDMLGGASSILVQNADSILKTEPKDAESELNFDTNGGNASLVYLYSKIDRGIQIRYRQKKGENATYWRAFYKRFAFVPHVTTYLYVVLVFFEIPYWCIKRIENVEDKIRAGTSRENLDASDYTFVTQDSGNLESFNYCSPEIYYNSDLPKFPLWSTYVIELYCIGALYFFNLVRSWYLKFDTYQLRLYRIQNFLYVISLCTFSYMVIMRSFFQDANWHNFIS